MSAPQSELTVVTKAKDLCRYVMTVTEKSPKRFRFTLVSRMQNLALDVIEQAYRANDIYVAGAGREAAAAKRLDLQHSALTAVKLLGYIALLANEQGCILPRQYENIAKLVSDCQHLLGAWIASDRRRTHK
ncbi:MAG: four helix bundle protein [Synergistaceae bacterium]|nr:four helix bundle protein [Synergistaceae bacterium]